MASNPWHMVADVHGRLATETLVKEENQEQFYVKQEAMG